MLAFAVVYQLYHHTECVNPHPSLLFVECHPLLFDVTKVSYTFKHLWCAFLDGLLFIFFIRFSIKLVFIVGQTSLSLQFLPKYVDKSYVIGRYSVERISINSTISFFATRSLDHHGTFCSLAIVLFTWSVESHEVFHLKDTYNFSGSICCF